MFLQEQSSSLEYYAGLMFSARLQSLHALLSYIHPHPENNNIHNSHRQSNFLSLDDNYSISISNNITTCQLITHNQPDKSPTKQEKEACICR